MDPVKPLKVDQNLCSHLYVDTGVALASLPPAMVYKCLNCQKEKTVVYPTYKPKIYTEGDLNKLQSSLNGTPAVMRF